LRTVITVIGKDAVGITAKVSAVCAKRNANIVDISQSVLKDLFVMVMLAEISELNCSLSEFSEEFQALGKESGLEIRVIHEDVFDSMHKI